MSSFDIRMTVPEYFKRFINKDIDLDETTKVCCPFHKEDTPSFSYNPSTGRCRCFGSCHDGGDVVDLHRMNFHLDRRDRLGAEESLRRVLGLPSIKVRSLEQTMEPVIVNEEDVEMGRIYHLCLIHANCVSRWVDMDYVMSFYPPDVGRLKSLLKEWGVKYE